MKKIILFFSFIFLSFNANVLASKTIIDESLSETNNLPLSNFLNLENKKTYQKELSVSKNNFGMLDLLIKMQNLDDDGIIFRIKEVGDENWHYENFYDSEFFNQGLYYSFGFNPFNDSENKKYLVEIEPVDINQNNSIKLFLNNKNQDSWTWRAAIDQNFKEILKTKFASEWRNKISSQRPFFIFWFFLLGLNLSVLLLVLFSPTKTKKPPF